MGGVRGVQTARYYLGAITYNQAATWIFQIQNPAMLTVYSRGILNGQKVDRSLAMLGR